jgi:hypothetical protein
MKKTILIASALTIFFGVQLLTSNKSEAGTTCETNYLGQVVCSGDNGSQTWKQSNTGSWETQDARGNTQQSCRTNAFGQFVCD